ncbi:C-type mannose receptor 2-like [Saccoglossus kowalevskii]
MLGLLVILIVGGFAVADPIKRSTGGITACIPEYQVLTDKMTWDDAKAACESSASWKLAEIRSQAQQDAIKAILPAGDDHYWIGVKDVVGDNKNYEYATGGSVIYTDWSSNEPNNYKGTAEDCVELRGNHDYEWNDIPCSNKIAAVCEFKRIPEYLILTDKITWQDAKAECELQCGRLAEICSQAEQDAVTDFLPEGEDNYWIGVSDVVGDKENFEYVTGGPVIYTGWLPHEPNNHNDHVEDCVELRGKKGYGWNDAPCNVKRFPLCEF